MSDPASVSTDVRRTQVRAVLLGERIDLRSLQHVVQLGERPRVVRAGEKGRAALFPYGAVVLFDLQPLEEASLLASVTPLVSGSFAEPEREEVEIVEHASQKDHVDRQGVIYVPETDLDRVQIVADILAKSVVLAHYESRVAEVFDRVEPLARHLEQGRRRYVQGQDLVRQIAHVLLIQHKTVGRVEIIEKPELLWERPELEQLYLRLEDEYELQERNVILDRKLDLISKTAETYLNLLQSKRSLRVEWYIVILILVEIFLTLFEMVTKG